MGGEGKRKGKGGKGKGEPQPHSVSVSNVWSYGLGPICLGFVIESQTAEC